MAALGTLVHLTHLQLTNITVSTAEHLAPLTKMTQLQRLVLNQPSKVAPLFKGDDALIELGKMSQLLELSLKGKLSNLTEDGLQGLMGLKNLQALTISWVPWQSHITRVSSG